MQIFHFDEGTSDDQYSFQSTVPSIIVLEERQSSLRIDNGDASILMKSIGHPTKQKIFQKVGSLYSMLDRDLRTRTATTTASTSADNSIQQLGTIMTNNISQDVSDDDTTTLSDNDYDKDYLITRTVSSISSPSFDDNSLNQVQYSEDDPLNIFDMQDDVMNAIYTQERKENSIRDKRDLNMIKYNLSLSYCLECKDEQNNNQPDFDWNIFIKESLLSYDDKNLDIMDGVSYDEVDSVSIDLPILIETMKRHQLSEDDKADLNNLCEESIHSNSVVSFRTESDH